MALHLSLAHRSDVALAVDPRTARADLVRLATHRNKNVRTAVASRRDCPLATMLSLVHDESDEVAEALALNPSAPHAVLAVLSAHRREVVRVLAAGRLRSYAAAA